jgi:hypothetical protein
MLNQNQKYSNARKSVTVSASECRFAALPCDARTARSIAHDLRDGVPVVTRCIAATVPPTAAGEVTPRFTSLRLAAMFDEMVDSRTGRRIAA